MLSENTYIDINADLGEGAGNDRLIMPFISSCNVACGGHYGDSASMTKTIRLAVKRKVKIGVHPSFPDTDNFGRKVLTISKEELSKSILTQLIGFLDICATEGVTMHHVKPHGALYNYAAKDAPTADAIVEAILATKQRPILYVPYNSILHRKSENLLPIRFEAFIDRRYETNGSLVSRSFHEAIIHDPELAWNQLERMVKYGTITAISGTEIKTKASTFCIHGDHVNSVKILEYIHERMKDQNIFLK